MGRKILSLGYPPNSQLLTRKCSWAGAKRRDFVETLHTMTPLVIAQMRAAVNDSSCMEVHLRLANNSKDWIERRLNYLIRCYRESNSLGHPRLIAPLA